MKFAVFFFRKSGEKIQISIKSDKDDGQFTCKLMYIYDNTICIILFIIFYLIFYFIAYIVLFPYYFLSNFLSNCLRHIILFIIFI